MSDFIRRITCSALLIASAQALAWDLPEGGFVYQLGAYIATTGEDQHINIDGLIGNNYDTDNDFLGNGLLGLGYYFQGIDKPQFKLDYGVDAFYLFATEVKGTVTQEDLFTNLAYQYEISHLPVYAMGKAIFMNKTHKYGFTADLGVGANFVFMKMYQEHSLDGITIPDNAFKDRTTAVFSATAGLGFKMEVSESSSFELGYRFFYLGEGQFDKRTPQFEGNFESGTNYANAIVLTVNI